MTVSADRIRDVNSRPIAHDGSYVLYWMIASRRTRSNCALEHAVQLSNQLDRPLLVLEALGVDYPWASDRIHQFVIQGMGDNAKAFARAGVRYWPYVESQPGAGDDLLVMLSQRACVVVTDDFPCFHLPRLVATAGKRLEVRLDAVDSNGLLPLRATDRALPTAHGFRSHSRRLLPDALAQAPEDDPLASYAQRPAARIPKTIAQRWPAASASTLADPASILPTLPIDHRVGAVDHTGGAERAQRLLHDFVEHNLLAYGESRNDPDTDTSSGLSAHLHFGHIGPHEILRAITAGRDWSVEMLEPSGHRARLGYWNLPPAIETFIDQFVTWRELGYTFCANQPGYDQFESLPDWALKTIDEHAGDPRDAIYSLEQLDAAATSDPVWNAAQTELVTTGHMHNYLRMLWGKKIIGWTEHPRIALDYMIELNNRYALDGRDPNSYSGIFWCLGRFDRAWGPERAVFGKLRYMTSQSTLRKLKLKRYLARFGTA